VNPLVPGNYADLLNPEKALIFRITHRDNVPWILTHGMHARNGALADPKFRPIGNPELILKRSIRPVPAGPGGTLGDYIPFYFTPFSMMLMNVITGFHGVPQAPKRRLQFWSRPCGR
jgi:hypothetical protein